MPRVQWWLLGIAALLAGCQPQAIVIGGKTNPKRIQTLVSLSPNTTEVSSTAALYNILRGRTKSCNWPVNLAKLPVYGDVKPDYEKLARLKPDAIVLDPSLYSTTDIQKLKDLGIEVIEFKAGTLAEFKDSVFKFGARTGGESYLSTYIDKIEAAEGTSQADAITPTPKVAVIMAGKGSEHMVAGTKGFVGDIIRAAAAEPVGPDSGKWETVSAERLLQDNPDVILFAGEPTSFIKDPRFASLKAVKSGRFGALNQDVVLRAGSRVDKFIESAHKIIATAVRGA
jgi:iron complex transport system substrate-binding protein